MKIPYLLTLALWLPSCFGQTTTPYFSKDIYDQHYTRHVQMVYQNQVTFITLSATKDDDPYIWAYHHGFKKWEGPVKVDENSLSPMDQHGNPSMVVDPKGYVHVWYGSHSDGPENGRKYARSKNPYDIRSWIFPEFPRKYTYPTPFIGADGHIYCFFRAGTHSNPGSDPWILHRSTDNGLTWAPFRQIVAKMPNLAGGGLADVYVWLVPIPGEDRIAFASRDQYSEVVKSLGVVDKIWYFEYDFKEDCFYTAGGVKVETKKGLNYTELMEHFLIADFVELGNTKHRIETYPAILKKKDGSREVFVVTPGGNMISGGSRIWKWVRNESKWTFTDPTERIPAWLYCEEGRFAGWARGAKFQSDEKGNNWKQVDEINIPGVDGSKIGLKYYNPYYVWHKDAFLLLHSSAFSMDNGIEDNKRKKVMNERPEANQGAFLYGASGALPKSTLTAPSGLMAQEGKDGVFLDWSDVAEGAITGYTIYRSTTEGHGYERVATQVKGSDYLDKNAPKGVPLYYSVTVTDSYGESPFSLEVSAKSAP